MTEQAGATTYERELLHCPDCETALEYVDSLEYIADGLATATVECPNEKCDFAAREDWVIDRTVRFDEDNTEDASEVSAA